MFKDLDLPKKVGAHGGCSEHPLGSWGESPCLANVLLSSLWFGGSAGFLNRGALASQPHRGWPGLSSWVFFPRRGASLDSTRWTSLSLWDLIIFFVFMTISGRIEGWAVSVAFPQMPFKPEDWEMKCGE